MSPSTHYTFDPRSRLIGLRFVHGVGVIAAGVGGVSVFVLLLLAALYAYTGASEQLIVRGVVGAGSVAALAAWVFTYSATTIPYAKPKMRIQELKGSGTKPANVAPALDARLLDVLRKSYHRGNNRELLAFVPWLLKTAEGRMVIERLQLSQEELESEIASSVLPNLTWNAFAADMAERTKEHQRPYVSIGDALLSLLLDPAMKQWMRRQKLQETDIKFMVWWAVARKVVSQQANRWWDTANLLDFTGIGISWAAGYTPFVDQFSRAPQGNSWDIGLAHEPQVEALVTSLARTEQSNVLLVGQPGVGRVGVVRELMRRVAAGNVHPALKSQRVLYVHVSQLLGLGASPQEQLAIVSRALSEMERAGNIIVVLDGLGSVLGSGGEAAVNFTDALAPFFNSASVRVVVVMSLDDFRARIAGNSELERLFEVVEVPPLSYDETLKHLALSVERWEEKHNVFLPYRTLEEIVRSTSSILPHIPFPEKAFDVLDEIVVEAEGKEQKVVTQDDVFAVISRKTGVDFGKVRSEESNKLLSLADFIHQRVVNQHEGVEAVSRAMIRARAGVRSQGRPIGTFLFLGPTGVGKTETAKALAEAYFGSEEYLRRLDMSEFQNEDAISRLIGSQQQPVGRLTGLVAEHPFSVILLDEFEKASVAVQELFLPLFDEGYITDARGRRYSFVHSIIIATSNAGSELIRTSMKDGVFEAGFDTTLREHILQQGVFLPELLNRFDGVITFTPLSVEHVREIAIRMLTGLNARLDAQHGITIAVDDELVEYLVQAGYDVEFGARPMRRLIQDTIEYWVARQLLSGNTTPGQQLRVPVAHLQKNLS